MTARTKIAFLAVLATLLATLPVTRAQEKAVVDRVGALPLTTPVPADPAVSTGTLPNGLRYYIRVNKQPVNRAELRLAVNVGSILEDDDQQGLAHFVEHMAFNGTTHFAKQEIVAFMESIGMRFGPSLNAGTSFDETVYMLQIPTDKPEVMDRSFLILEDWAHNLTFDPAEIDKERGVIVEEWRLGRGAAARLRDQQLPVLLKGSRYAERLPIGKKEIIETFKHDRLKKFYADWYRPDLMAVVAVGDFDRAAVEAMIKKHFGSLPKPAAPRLRPSYKVPAQPDTLYAIAADREMPTTTVAVYNKLGERDPTTVGSFRQALVERLYTGMFNRRMSELAQKPDPPFVSGGAGRGNFIRGMQAATLNALVKEDGLDRGLEGLLVESNRVARFGFTSTEFDRQKKDMLRSYERQYAEREKQESVLLASRYVANFTDRLPFPSVEEEYALCQRFLPEIALAEVNALAKDWMSPGNRVVMVTAPQKDGLVLPDATRLAATMARAGEKEVTAYVDTVATASLIDKPPAPGKIVKTTTLEAYGMTEWQLSNGIRVVLKPTTNKQDEVLFRATSPGGTSLVGDADYRTAEAASQIVGASGVGQFSAIQLRNLLAGKVANARPSITETDEMMTGAASVKDLETLFQLTYLSFTAPRLDPAIYGMLTTQLKTLLKNQAATPAFAFNAALQGILTQDHARYRPMTADVIDTLNPDKALAIYRERFADAGDFTFVYVGSFTLDAIRPYVEQYLASLPTTGRKETWKDVGMRRPTGVIEKTVTKGMEPQARVAIAFSGPFDYNQVQRVAMRALGSILDTRLRETVREDLGGTYGISASPSYSKAPIGRYDFSISFGCSPQRTEELTKAVFKEIEALQSVGPTEKQVNDVREAFMRDLETSMKDNTYLVSQISMRYQFGEDVKTLFAMADYYKQLTPTLIQEAARTYLKKDRFVRVTLLPEAAPEKK
jgi:zinc protease